jgi:hypothetical protein
VGDEQSGYSDAQPAQVCSGCQPSLHVCSGSDTDRWDGKFPGNHAVLLAQDTPCKGSASLCALCYFQG